MIKKPLLWLILLFAFTRLWNLTLLPMFSDEALYIEWGWRATHYSGQLFHSLQDAKQPFIMWFFGLGQILFPDPLWGSRIVAVLFGLLAMLGIYAVGRRLYGQTTAPISALLYIVNPFFVFFDRQAFVDSAVIAFSVWSFYFFLRLRHQPKFINALALGTTLGLGFFTKTTSVLFLIAFFTTQIFLCFRQKQTAVIQMTLSIFVLIVFLLVNFSLLFQPAYWLTLSSNSRWSFTLSELLHFPVSSWLTNLFINFQLSLIYFTPPLFILLVFSLYQAFRTRRLLFFWICFPMLIYLLVLRSTGAILFRYLPAFLPLTLPPLAAVISRRPKLFLPLLIFPFIWSLIFIFNPLLFFSLQAKITRHTYQPGYVTGYDTGYHLNEIVKYLKTQTAREPVYIGIAVHSFNPESGIWNYFRKDKNAVTSYLDAKIFPPGLLDRVDCITVDRPLYFVAKLDDTAGLEKYLEKVTVITNPNNPDFSTIYTLKKDCAGKTLRLDPTQPLNH